MERKGRRPGFWERTAEVFDLPADALAGLPKLELVGDRELWVENHRGILSYGDREILISGGAFLIRVAGEELELRAMTGVELLITGRVAQIDLGWEGRT